MLYLTILSVCLFSVTCQAKPWFRTEDAEQHFEEFIATYNKQYNDDSEKNMRFLIFKENLNTFNEMNSMGHAEYGITKFADLTQEEFGRLSRCFLPLENEMSSCVALNGWNGTKRGSAPESLDWRDQMKVSSVKNQGRCGSCWAFSVVGNVEGQYAIKHNQLVEFSPQQLVDCDKFNLGCRGGWPHKAMTWLAKNGGSMTEKAYPYHARVETCKADKSKAVAKVTGCNVYRIKNEDELKQILANVGPLAVALDASSFMGYKGGIITCSPDQNSLGHAVLLVGYGKENGVPYWLFKNSWDTSYGELGYFRLKMYENSCNMTAYIVSAVVA